MNKAKNRTTTETANETDFLFEPVALEKFQTLTQSQLIEYVHGQQDMIHQLSRIVKELKAQNDLLENKTLLLGEQFVVLRRGRRSQKVHQNTRPRGDHAPRPSFLI